MGIYEDVAGRLRFPSRPSLDPRHTTPQMYGKVREPNPGLRNDFIRNIHPGMEQSEEKLATLDRSRLPYEGTPSYSYGNMGPMPEKLVEHYGQDLSQRVSLDDPRNPRLNSGLVTMPNLNEQQRPSVDTPILGNNQAAGTLYPGQELSDVASASGTIKKNVNEVVKKDSKTDQPSPTGILFSLFVPRFIDHLEQPYLFVCSLISYDYDEE